MLVLKMPLTPAVFSSEETGINESVEEDATQPKASHPSPRAAARRVSARHLSSRPNTIRVESPTSPTVHHSSAPLLDGASSNDRQVTRVVDDSEVYSVNSPTGTIVKLLK